MRKFNTSDIFTGYLKQLLKTFNLPKLKVYTREHEEYYKKYGKERADILNTITEIEETTNNKTKVSFPDDIHYIPYIREGQIQEYINGSWNNIGERLNKKTHPSYYAYGEKLLNYTKNLTIKNNVYDSYTHEYLGEYLRFQRDYNNLNLMSLYNCFSNKFCDNLYLNENITINFPETNRSTQCTVLFDSNNTEYKIYMLPVKLFQDYTIAIDSELPIELCCGIYGDYQDTRNKFKPLTYLTYKKINKSTFSQPFLFEKLNFKSLENDSWNTLKKEVIKNEADLKLFIKLPKNNKSTIVVLEGNYINWNNFHLRKDPEKFIDVAAYFEKEADFNSAVATGANIYEGSIYLVKRKFKNDNGQEQDTYLVYKGVKGLTDTKTDVVCLGTIWDEKLNSTKNLDQFVFYADNTNRGASDIKQAFNIWKIQEKKNSPYVIYYNSEFSKLYIPATGWYKLTNHSVIDLDASKTGVTNAPDIPLISPLQLLQLNTKEQHPFSDRLIEYLTNNAIVGTDEEIAENIKRVQKALRENGQIGILTHYYPELPGIWDFKMNKLLYNYMVTHQNITGINKDILGYVDKDVEKYYTYKDQQTKQETSLLNTELDSGGN